MEGEGGKITFMDVLGPSPAIMDSFDDRARERQSISFAKEMGNKSEIKESVAS